MHLDVFDIYPYEEILQEKEIHPLTFKEARLSRADPPQGERNERLAQQ